MVWWKKLDLVLCLIKIHYNLKTFIMFLHKTDLREKVLRLEHYRLMLYYPCSQPLTYQDNKK